MGKQGGKGAVCVCGAGVCGAGRDWVHCPGDWGARKQALLLGVDTMTPLFIVVGRRSSVWRMPWGGLPGSRQRWEKYPLFRSKYSKKMCKKRHWHCWKSKAMFYSISIVGESRKCLFFIRTLRVVWLGGGNQASLCRLLCQEKLWGATEGQFGEVYGPDLNKGRCYLCATTGNSYMPLILQLRVQ